MTVPVPECFSGTRSTAAPPPHPNASEGQGQSPPTPGGGEPHEREGVQRGPIDRCIIVHESKRLQGWERLRNLGILLARVTTQTRHETSESGPELDQHEGPGSQTTRTLVRLKHQYWCSYIELFWILTLHLWPFPHFASFSPQISAGPINHRPPSFLSLPSPPFISLFKRKSSLHSRRGQTSGRVWSQLR